MDEHLLQLIKDENPEQYAKLANNGVLLGYPVKIKGNKSRPDNGVDYHSTIKYFDPAKDHPHSIHNLARHLPLNPPDAKNTQIKFDIFKDRMGNDVHVVSMHGNSADKIKEHNGKFAGMGFPSKFEWTPHISLDKDTWDSIKNSGAKTAHEAGIEFGPAELKKGPKTLKTYHHEPDSTEPKVPDQGDMTAKVSINKSEIILEKGILQNAGIALGMAGALAGASHSANAGGGRSPASIQQKKPFTAPYDHKKMLNAISQVESSGGKNTNHKPTSQGQAYGRWALMPNTIHDTIKGHKDLKAKYGKALALSGPQLHRFMQDNKGLENIIADRHLAHIEHNFKDNPDQIGFAWNQGITGTKRARNNKMDIASHPYVKKLKDAYGKGN